MLDGTRRKVRSQRQRCPEVGTGLRVLVAQGSTPRRPILEGGRSPTGKRCWTKNPEVVSSSLTARMESGKMMAKTIRQKEIQERKLRQLLDVRLCGADDCMKGVTGRWVRG